MTDHAIRGEPHRTLPGWATERYHEASPYWAVVPWTCPCGLPVADSVIGPGPTGYGVQTVLHAWPHAVHQRDADRDGVPFYGATRRELAGKGPRGKVERLAASSWAANRHSREARTTSGPLPSADYDPISAAAFYSACDTCARVLLFEVLAP